VDEFEFARSVTIGQYVPGTSIVHRIDPRAKLIAFVALIAAVITQASYLGNAVALAVVVAIVFASGIPFGYVLSGIRPLVPILIVYTAFNFVFLGNYDPTGSAVLWRQPIEIGRVPSRSRRRSPRRRRGWSRSFSPSAGCGYQGMRSPWSSRSPTASCPRSPRSSSV